jgi:hypothetical protein
VTGEARAGEDARFTATAALTTHAHCRPHTLTLSPSLMCVASLLRVCVRVLGVSSCFLCASVSRPQQQQQQCRPDGARSPAACTTHLCTATDYSMHTHTQREMHEADTGRHTVRAAEQAPQGRRRPDLTADKCITSSIPPSLWFDVVLLSITLLCQAVCCASSEADGCSCQRSGRGVGGCRRQQGSKLFCSGASSFCQPRIPVDAAQHLSSGQPRWSHAHGAASLSLSLVLSPSLIRLSPSLIRSPLLLPKPFATSPSLWNQ